MGKPSKKRKNPTLRVPLFGTEGAETIAAVLKPAVTIAGDVGRLRDTDRDTGQTVTFLCAALHVPDETDPQLAAWAVSMMPGRSVVSLTETARRYSVAIRPADPEADVLAVNPYAVELLHTYRDRMV